MIELENRPWRILLVEDDEDDFILTRALLSVSRGDRYDLLWVQDYQAALEKLETEELDAVLVDHYLGKQTGLDLIREAVNRGRKVPFILLTGNGSYELDVEAAKAGATDYLVKGEVSPPLLERTIRYAIARREVERELGRRTDHIEVQHRLIEQRELERLKIAQDLHDGPLQELIGMTFGIQEAISVLSEEEENEKQVQSKLQIMLGSLHKEIRGLRSFCGELRPPALAPYGLETAIRSHADSYHEKFPDIQVHLDLQQDGQTLAEPVRLALYRIYQELLNNISRHAKATEINVRFRVDEDQILLEIEDNGCGFLLPNNWIDFARQGHLGLVGVQERADAAGGQMFVESMLGRGTNVRVAIPKKAVG